MGIRVWVYELGSNRCLHITLERLARTFRVYNIVSDIWKDPESEGGFEGRPKRRERHHGSERVRPAATE